MDGQSPEDLGDYEDTASRFASVALTSSLTATALDRLASDPAQQLSPRLMKALISMSQTISKLAQLHESGELSRLTDRSLRVVDELEPVQLVARLADQSDHAPTDAQAARLSHLLQLRDKLKAIIDRPDAEIARELAPTFRRLGEVAITSASQAEETAHESGYSRLSIIHA